MYTLEGVSSVANFITAYEKTRKVETPLFQTVECFLFPKAIFFMFILYVTVE